MALTIRRATADDILTVEDIEYQAFRVHGQPKARERARQNAESHCGDYFIMEDEGAAVAQAQVSDHPLQVGRCVIRKADVGHVAVRPERQGEGLGSRLMQELMAMLPAEGFHCTRLGGLMSFYRRFGYEPFPRRYVQFEVRPLETDLKRHKWGKLLAVPEALAARVRPYDPRGDHHARWELLGRFNAGRPGRLVETEGEAAAPGTPSSPLNLVYEVDGVIRGYLHGFIGPVHAGQPDAYQVADFALDFDFPEAAEALLKTFLTQAAAIAPTTVTCRLPYDERLFDILNAAGLQFEVLEMRQGSDGNMMQVLDLAGMLAAVAPELSARLREAGVWPWEGTLDIRIPRHEAALRISRAGVTVGRTLPPSVGRTLPPSVGRTLPTSVGRTLLSGADASVRRTLLSGTGPTIETSHATILKWVLGLTGAAEYPWLTGHLTGPQRVTLAILFPRLPAASGAWG